MMVLSVAAPCHRVHFFSTATVSRSGILVSSFGLRLHKINRIVIKD